MTQQLPRPKDHVRSVLVFGATLRPRRPTLTWKSMSRGVTASPTPILTLKSPRLYNQYHEQYAWADEVGFDGIMSNEHHASYW